MSSGVRSMLGWVLSGLAGSRGPGRGIAGGTRRGGTLRLWFPNDFRTLDPAIA